jgi:hypothetical protein
MCREIEVIQIIGKRLIIHKDDHDNEKMAWKLASECGQGECIRMMSFLNWAAQTLWKNLSLL